MSGPTFFVVLVEPKYGGNIGAVARSMMNFGFNQLYLINPPDLDDECYQRAMHASSILDDATVVNSLTDVSSEFDYLVATSSVSTESEKKHLRNAIVLPDFAEKIFEVTGDIGLIFGREDHGLYNPEIAQCDMLLNIPSCDAYPSLNLSHAVNLVLYTLYAFRDVDEQPRREISGTEKERLYVFFSRLLDEIRYPEHKKEKTQVMFRRIMGRALPSKWEYHTLMGVLSEAIKRLQRENKK